MLCLAIFKCTCNMASTIEEMLSYDFCNLLFFSVFEIEEVLQLFLSSFIFPFDTEFLPYSYRKSSLSIQISSVQLLSRVWLFATPWMAARQASLSITNSPLKLMFIESVMPFSHLILCRPLFLPPTIPPSMSLFQWVNSSHEVAKVLQCQLQHHSFQRNPRADLLQNGLVGPSCSPRDSQESSPTPQFKSINSSALSLLHSPTLTSIHDHRKNHSLD